MSGYLTFDIAGTPFAVEGGRVVEVAEATRATRLPFAPPHVEGIANVGGRLLPVVDVTGFPAARLAWGGGRRGGLLIVLSAGRGLLALRAGRIGGSLPAEGAGWEEGGEADAGLPVAGRLLQGGRSLRVLDPDRLELGAGGLPVPDADALAGAAAAPPDAGRDRATVRMLMVEAGGRIHALAMGEVLVVFPVEEIRPLPNPPPLVVGMGQVQRRPVLLVDPLEAASGTGGYAVALRTRFGPVGVRVDAVRGVIRLPRDRIKAGEAGAPDEIVDYDGRWLDVRNATRMLGDRLDRIGPLVPEGGEMDGSRLPQRLYRRFLTFVVEARLYAVAFEKVRRVVESSDRLRLPRGAESFDGLTDVDGRILPILDLRRLLARRPVGSDPQSEGVAILLEIDGGPVAVIADEIQRIRKVPADDVDPMSDRLTEAVIRVDGALIPVLRPEGLTTPAAPALPPTERVA